MAIEQRIGRIDRIGQTREVFVFNLVTTGTIEDEVLRILDEKINMFELVVGEVGAILGEFEDQHNFSGLVLDAWLRSSEEARSTAFVELEGQLVAARRQYDDAKGTWTTRCSGTSSMPPEMQDGCRALSPTCCTQRGRVLARSPIELRKVLEVLALASLCSKRLA